MQIWPMLERSESRERAQLARPCCSSRILLSGSLKCRCSPHVLVLGARAGPRSCGTYSPPGSPARCTWRSPGPPACSTWRGRRGARCTFSSPAVEVSVSVRISADFFLGRFVGSALRPRASGVWVGSRRAWALRSPWVAPCRACRRSALSVRGGALLVGEEVPARCGSSPSCCASLASMPWTSVTWLGDSGTV